MIFYYGIAWRAHVRLAGQIPTFTVDVHLNVFAQLSDVVLSLAMSDGVGTEPSDHFLSIGK